jgi:hypothetical protein
MNQSRHLDNVMAVTKGLYVSVSDDIVTGSHFVGTGFPHIRFSFGLSPLKRRYRCLGVTQMPHTELSSRRNTYGHPRHAWQSASH